MRWYWWTLIGYGGLVAVFVFGWAWFVSRGRTKEWELADRADEAAYWKAYVKAQRQEPKQ